MIKKNVKNYIIAIVALLLLSGVLVYFFVQLNRTEKKALAVQESAVKNAQTISGVVNFFNSTNQGAQK